MAISFDIFTHDLMHRWQERMLESVWRFNQFADPTPYGDYGAGKEPVYLQYHREVIAQALLLAFDEVTGLLGYFPQPSYVKDKIIPIGRKKKWDKDVFNIGLAYGIAFGTEEFGDTILYETSITKPNEYRWLWVLNVGSSNIGDFRNLHIYLNVGVDDEQRRTLFPAPIELYRDGRVYIQYANTVSTDVLREAYTDDGLLNILDRDTSSNFSTNYSLYEVSVDSDEAVKLLSISRKDGVSIEETVVSAEFSNPRRGEFILGKDEDDPPGEPFAIKASFLSGKPLGFNYHMDTSLESAIIQLATINFSMRNLPYSHLALASWQEANGTIEDGSGRVSPELVNPLGRKVGHYEAWNIIRNFSDFKFGKARKNLVY